MGFHDPAVMLKGARTIAAMPEMQALARNLRKGDIVLTAEFLPGDPVTGMTGGPYNHALLCVKDGPQAEFIEAIGVTGAQNDPTGSQVRRARLVDYAIRHIAFRVLRPADALPANKRAAAIDKAVAYAEAQLGRPYDYAFTNRDQGPKGEKAFYCSELTWAAWSAPQGAGVRLPVSESPSRNVGMRAVQGVLDLAGPERPNSVLRPLVRSIMAGADGGSILRKVGSDVLPNLRGPDLGAMAMSAGRKLRGIPETPRFVSPTDLAWGGLPVQDFNAKGRKLDP